uniref:Uncharacterized protein n=1 Tax=Romanomermis culicivorax TaxID=13658 RepID=A0A915KL70_ROMCU
MIFVTLSYLLWAVEVDLNIVTFLASRHVDNILRKNDGQSEATVEIMCQDNSGNFREVLKIYKRQRNPLK